MKISYRKLEAANFHEVAKKITTPKSERLCDCVLGVSILTFYDLDIWFWNCSDGVYFFFSFY